MHHTFMNYPRKNWNIYQWGFSAVEILIVIAIVALLVAIAVPSYENYVHKKNITQAKSDILEIQTAIEKYYVLNNEFPDSLEAVGKDQLKDPWKNHYFYVNVSLANNKGSVRKDKNLTPVNSDYDLYSAGKDGITQLPFTAKASKDDVVRCNNGSFIGLVEEY
ncbi:type IV pilin protein [Kaarinaea lacus]